MSRLRFVTLLLILSFALTPLAVFAQDGEMLVEEYVSEDELLSFEYPAGWLVYEDDESPFPAVGVVNTEEALARIDADETQISGDAVFLIMVLPTAFFELIGETFPVEADAAEQAEYVVELFFESDENPDALDVEINELDDFELESGVVVGTVEVYNEEEEGAFAVFMPSEGVLVIVYAAAYADEFNDEQAEQGLALIESLSYTGTSDELMAMLLSGVADDGSGDTSMDTADGASLVETRCSVCHTTERIENADKDEAGWTATVDRMIGKGAVLDAAEREAVIAYLSGM